jgi:hypothetical protein
MPLKQKQGRDFGAECKGKTPAQTSLVKSVIKLADTPARASSGNKPTFDL